MIGLCISLPFYITYVAAPTWQIAILLLAVPSTLNMFYLAPVLTVVQNYTAPAQRGGRTVVDAAQYRWAGRGSAFTAGLSDHFGAIHGPAQGLRYAMFSLGPVYLVAIGCFLISARLLHNHHTPGQR